jgi:hypothetical protein
VFACLHLWYLKSSMMVLCVCVIESTGSFIQFLCTILVGGAVRNC